MTDDELREAAMPLLDALCPAYYVAERPQLMTKLLPILRALVARAEAAERERAAVLAEAYPAFDGAGQYNGGAIPRAIATAIRSLS